MHSAKYIIKTKTINCWSSCLIL